MNSTPPAFVGNSRTYLEWRHTLHPRLEKQRSAINNIPLYKLISNLPTSELYRAYHSALTHYSAARLSSNNTHIAEFDYALKTIIAKLKEKKLWNPTTNLPQGI